MTEVLLPYADSPGWSLKTGPAGHSPGFEDPDYDVSSWTVATLPVGITNPSSGPACGRSLIRTHWSSGHNDDVCVRREIPGGIRDVEVSGFVDDNVAVYWNGTLLFEDGAGTISSGPWGPLAVPENVLGGKNVLAVRGRDRRAVCAYLDVEVSYVAGGWKVGAL